MLMRARLDIAKVYDDHVWQVYAYFAYRVGVRSEAEDLTQTTFERAVRSAQRYDPERAAPLTWLLAIAHNLLVDHYRRARGTPVDLDDDDPSWGSVPFDADLGLSPELTDALAHLTPRDREIVGLRFGADLSGPEIAELTGLSLANVQQVLSRSLRRLRRHLDPEA
jgi:RNA polymerase sigma factor (sigma-70 family)